jgi:hypothetical protein
MYRFCHTWFKGVRWKISRGGGFSQKRRKVDEKRGKICKKKEEITKIQEQGKIKSLIGENVGKMFKFFRALEWQNFNMHFNSQL